MNCALSCTNLESFVGNVTPLWLVCDEDISKTEILWRVDDASVVSLRDFAGEDPQSISHGVLLTLKKAGSASVTATLDGVDYVCSVSVREMKTAKAGEPLQYFFGDFHAHTSKEHNHAKFAALEENPVDTYLDIIKQDDRLHCTVITDHAVTTNDRDFFHGFAGAEERSHLSPVLLPGSESEVTVVEWDRFGIPYKNSGEIVFLNTTQFVNPHDWQTFYDALEKSPFGVCILAHPYVVGHSVKGIWNFSLHKNDPPVFRDRLRGVEMGNGIDRQSNMINEYMYSVALDNGFRVSPTCGSDHHGNNWGFGVCPGKTILMAYENSKEAFLDALFNRRFYATESGNVKVYYTVNGVEAAGNIPLTNKYRFHVELSNFWEDPAAVPVCCRVISDRGECLKEITGDALGVLDFEIESDTARYFYLRVMDGNGLRTWSAPVWTGRDFEKPHSVDLPPVLDQSGFTVTETESGKDASVLVNGDPQQVWLSDLTSASYVIDMGCEQEVSALGHYAFYVNRADLKNTEPPTPLQEVIARFPSRYEIAVSTDGVHFTTCNKGQIRVFSGEEVLRFAPCKARYLRFTVGSTVGAECGLTRYADAKICMAELSVFGV
jgi:hypothetical protein